jgi:hypothetical protein
LSWGLPFRRPQFHRNPHLVNGTPPPSHPPATLPPEGLAPGYVG